VEGLLRYRPVDAARGLRTPLMVVAVEGDATTPTDHATAIYEVAEGPKKLLLQRNTTHYAAYEKYGADVIPVIVDWFDTHLTEVGDITVVTEPSRRPTPTNLGA
jgi:uncharacterized protein